VTAWRVRPFADADYTAYARIASIADGERMDASSARAVDARWDRERYDRLRVVAVDEEDAPGGYGEIHHDPRRYDPRRYVLRLGVDPERRRRGICAALWAGLAAELGRRSAEVVGLWAGDATACQAFVTKRGFVEVARSYAQVLAVASAPLPTRATLERVTSTGVRVTTLAALRDALGDAAHRHHLVGVDERVVGRHAQAVVEEPMRAEPHSDRHGGEDKPDPHPRDRLGHRPLTKHDAGF